MRGRRKQREGPQLLKGKRRRIGVVGRSGEGRWVGW